MNKEMSNKQYNLVIGLILLWGFTVNAILCIVFPDVFISWNQTAVLIGYFISAVIGICMSAFSKNPIISFLGYNLIVLPIGVVLSIALQNYYVDSIIRAIISALFITILMIVIAAIKPELFAALGTILFICLFGVIIIEFVMILFGGPPKWWDVIVAMLFCGYIGYDWSKAQEKPRTLDNAVDAAVDLYLDIINLFLRLLGRNSSQRK